MWRMWWKSNKLSASLRNINRCDVLLLQWSFIKQSDLSSQKVNITKRWFSIFLFVIFQRNVCFKIIHSRNHCNLFWVDGCKRENCIITWIPYRFIATLLSTNFAFDISIDVAFDVAVVITLSGSVYFNQWKWALHNEIKKCHHG